MGRMLRVTILSLVGLLALPAAYGSERKMMEKLNKYNLLAQCYGEEKMDQWVLAMHKAMEFCHEIQSPAQTLPGPLGAGANNQLQATSCAQYQIVTYMERFWGPMDDLANHLELPLDKYDAAKVAIGVMYNAATPEMKFVDDFFWQKSKFQ